MLERMAGRMVTGRVAFFLSGLIDVTVLVLYLARRWGRGRRRGAGVVCAVAVLVGTLAITVTGALAPTARADTTEQSILMDDGAFIYSSPAQVERHLQQAAALGVTTVKVSMVWSLVAPDPLATTEPRFDATNPDAYPTNAWTRYDTLVQEAGALGLRLYFQLTAPAPLWATNPTVTGHQHPWSHDIDVADFTAFTVAVGARYSGLYTVAGDGDTYGPYAGGEVGNSGSAPTKSMTGTSTTTSTTTSAAAATSAGTTGTGSTTTGSSSTPTATIPAVRMWGIWNEPNEVGWISPQTAAVDGHTVAESPITERHLINAGYDALAVTGHARDTILIGETASGGNTHTIPFVQALFCVSADNQPLTGQAAALEDCPADGDRQTFVRDNPGLFRASGWAHHPYSFDHTPATPFADAPSTITLANIGKLEHELDAVDATYGQPTGLPIYMTEWGFKSNPPNPFVHTNLSEQATWMDEGWYMSYLMPRVRAMSQELLYDQPPVPGTKPGTLAYWNSIDSGLEFQDQRQKPAYAAFRLPIWLPVQRAGSQVRLWAEIRPAQVSHNPVGVLEYEAPGSEVWTELSELRSSSPEGFIYTRVEIPHPGLIRLAWYDPMAKVIDYSRTVQIS